MEESPSADQVAVVEGHIGGEDLCVGAQQGALPPSLTLDPSTEDVAARDRKTRQRHQEVKFPLNTEKQEVNGSFDRALSCNAYTRPQGAGYSRASTGNVGAVGQLTTVSIFVSLFVDGGETHGWSTGGI